VNPSSNVRSIPTEASFCLRSPIVDIGNFTDYFPRSIDMRALLLRKPGQADQTIADPVLLKETNVLLKVRFVGFYGSYLNSYRRLNPLVTYPRILGHGVAATVLQDLRREAILSAGTNVAVSPYTSCGECSSCLRGRPQRLPVQSDSRGAKGWRTNRIHRDAARKAVSRESGAQKIEPGGTAHSRISCRHTDV